MHAAHLERVEFTHDEMGEISQKTEESYHFARILRSKLTLGRARPLLLEAAADIAYRTALFQNLRFISKCIYRDSNSRPH